MLPPRLLITGANGLVGQALQRSAARWRGADVLATSRSAPSALPHRTGGCARLAVTDPEADERVFQDLAPDVVLHAAGSAQVEA
ncbi:MAG: sugar nucleotide-binding protein, partial [Bacteroidota bacterium]